MSNMLKTNFLCTNSKDISTVFYGQDARSVGRACPCRWMCEEVAAVSSPFSTRSSTPSSAMSSQRHSSSTACACEHPASHGQMMAGRATLSIDSTVETHQSLAIFR